MKTTQEKIEVKAFQRYLRRNKNGGNPIEDWLDAEKEVKRDMNGLTIKGSPLAQRYADMKRSSIPKFTRTFPVS